MKRLASDRSELNDLLEEANHGTKFDVELLEEPPSSVPAEAPAATALAFSSGRVSGGSVSVGSCAVQVFREAETSTGISARRGCPNDEPLKRVRSTPIPAEKEAYSV